jgi:hypothetical protein
VSDVVTNEELAEQVAERVLGWRRIYPGEWLDTAALPDASIDAGKRRAVPLYPTPDLDDWRTFGLIVETLRERGWTVSVYIDEAGVVWVELATSTIHDTRTVKHDAEGHPCEVLAHAAVEACSDE